MKADKSAKPKDDMYIVFSPTGPTPPMVIHKSHGAAFSACHFMAARHPDQKFFVMKRASRAISVAAACTASVEE